MVAHNRRLTVLSFGSLWVGAAILVLLSGPAATAQTTPEQAADMLLTSARRAYNEKNYTFAVDKFKEFTMKYGNHKEIASARYGLALALIDGPTKDYQGAADQLQNLVNNKDLPDYPFVLYYLGLSQRGLGVREMALATTKPNEAEQHRNAAKQRFDDAGKQFTAAIAAFTARVPKPDPDAKELAPDLEWAVRARCDFAEMQLRQLKPQEARTAVQPILEDKVFAKSRYQHLALYYHGFASFLLKENNDAGRSLTKLAPYTDPIFG